MELEESRPALQKSGRNLAAISYDTVAILADFGARRKIGFPLLSDEGSAFIRQLGILNEKLPKDSFRFGVPYPGLFVLDRNGKIISKSFEADPKERETLGAILSSTLDLGSGLAQHRHETKHLIATTSSSNAVIRPYQVMRLRLDVKLKRGMHVYAPGVSGYKAIAWDLDPSPAYTTRRRVLPPSRQLKLRAIGETVEVYDRDFGLQIEVAFSGNEPLRKITDANGQLRLAGNFSYQACDHKVCYLPITIPLSWNLQYEHLEEPRVPESIRHKNPSPKQP